MKEAIYAQMALEVSTDALIKEKEFKYIIEKNAGEEGVHVIVENLTCSSVVMCISRLYEACRQDNDEQAINDLFDIALEFAKEEYKLKEKTNGLGPFKN